MQGEFIFVFFFLLKCSWETIFCCSAMFLSGPANAPWAAARSRGAAEENSMELARFDCFFFSKNSHFHDFFLRIGNLGASRRASTNLPAASRNACRSSFQTRIVKIQKQETTKIPYLFFLKKNNPVPICPLDRGCHRRRHRRREHFQVAECPGSFFPKLNKK